MIRHVDVDDGSHLLLLDSEVLVGNVRVEGKITESKNPRGAGEEEAAGPGIGVDRYLDRLEQLGS